MVLHGETVMSKLFIQEDMTQESPAMLTEEFT